MCALVSACGVAPPEPSDTPDYRVAIGDISHSFPVLSPLKPYGDRRELALGELRDEQLLAQRVGRPTISIDQATATFQEISAALAYGGEQVSRTSTSRRRRDSEAIVDSSSRGDVSISIHQASERAATGAAPAQTKITDESTSEVTRSSGTPAIPGVPAQISPDSGVQGRLGELLERAQRDFVLSPEDVATIVASLKMYMVGLEEFFNASAVYQAALRGDAEWFPYRMSFVVTVEPGWFTRAGGHDAVAELELGAPGEVRIVNAVPPQTAQAIDQFTAEYKRLGTSLSASGSYNRVAAGAAVRRLKDAANRLQGIRANTTFSASFPAENRLRVRFHPLRVPDGKSSSDLQPTSRIVTATVLVKGPKVDKDVCVAAQTKQLKEQKTTAGPRATLAECGKTTAVAVKTTTWFEAKHDKRRRSGPAVLCVESGEKSEHYSGCRADEERNVTVPDWTALLAPALDFADVGGFFWDFRAGSTKPPAPGWFSGVLKFRLNGGVPQQGYLVTLKARGVCFRETANWEKDCEQQQIVYGSQANVFDLFVSSAAILEAGEIPAVLHVEPASVPLAAASNDTPSSVAEFKVKREGGASAGGGGAASGGPTIEISGGEVTLKSVPLKDIPADILRAIIGDRTTIAIQGEAKSSKTGASLKPSAAR